MVGWLLFVKVVMKRGKMENKITDKQRLDFLQGLNNKSDYTGRTVLRESTTGRGWRLHETSGHGAYSVRDAIDEYIEISQLLD